MKSYGNRIVLLITLLVSAAIYATLWNAKPLTWDDASNIFANPYYTMHRWWGTLFEPYFGLYVPVTSSFWALLYNLGQGASWPFRMFNILIHSANIFLLYIILKHLAGSWKIHAPLAIGLGVSVFALHPLQVESVAWISGGRDLLSTFFAFLTVILYFGRPSTRGYVLATVTFVCALLSKPSVAILPIAFVVIDRFVTNQPWRVSLRRMSLWVALSLVAIYLTRMAQVEHFTDRLDWWQRPLVMLDTYVFYFLKTLWPYPLAANYARTPEYILINPEVLGLSAAVFVAVTGLLIWGWSRDRRFAIFAILWALLLLPVSGVVPFGYQSVSQVADHYNYLPLAAVAVLFMIFLEKINRRPILMVLPIALTLAWSALSFERTKIWENDFTFFTDMTRAAPNSYSAAVGMSVVMCEQKKDFEAGLQWVDKALAVKAHDIIALSNRAYCLYHAGRGREVIAMQELLERVDRPQLSTTQPTPYSSLLATLGTVLIEERQYENGFRYLCEAFRVKPSEPNHTINLKAASEILRQQGLSLTCSTMVY